MPAASAAARAGPLGRSPPQPPHLARAVPVSGLPRPCGGRPRSPAPARAAASGPWPSSGCSPVPRPERSADPGTALGPGGARGRLGSPARPGRGARGAQGGSGPARGAYWPGWRGGAQAARWGTRSAPGMGARPTSDASSRLTSSAMALAAGTTAPGQRPPRGRTAQASPAARGPGDRGTAGRGPGEGGARAGQDPGCGLCVEEGEGPKSRVTGCHRVLPSRAKALARGVISRHKVRLTKKAAGREGIWKTSRRGLTGPTPHHRRK